MVADELTDTAAARTLMDHVIALAGEQPLQLPCAGAAIVDCIISKVEGSYRAVNAQIEIGHAADLLLIATNLDLGQERIRVQIDRLRNCLLDAHAQTVELLQRLAIGAQKLHGRIGRCLTTWEQLKRPAESAAISAFLNDDLLMLSEEIKAIALGPERKLNTIIDSYEQLQKLNQQTRGEIDSALGDVLTGNELVVAEFAKRGAKCKSFEEHISQWQAEVQRLEEQAWRNKDDMPALIAAYQAQPLVNAPVLREHIAMLELLEVFGNCAVFLQSELNRIDGEQLSEWRKHETVMHGYRSLNLCQSVLAKSRAIMEKLTMFLRSLMRLFNNVAADMQSRAVDEEAMETGSITTENRLLGTCRGIDEMFIYQGAHWLAIKQLASTWAGLIDCARSKLEIASNKFILSSALEMQLNQVMSGPTVWSSHGSPSWDWSTHKLRACLDACRKLIGQNSPDDPDPDS